MSFQIVIPPTAEPLSVTEAEYHARIDVTDNGSARRCVSAREWAEAVTWRALVLQTIEERFDGFPRCFQPLRTPLRAVVSITYLDLNGALQTLASTQYDVFEEEEPGLIEPAYNVTWPSTYAQKNAVRLRYRAGYAVPFTADAVTDVLTAIGHWFADGDAVQVWTSGGTIPTGLSAGTYYARDVVAGVSLKLAATSGGAAIDITAAGTEPNFLGEIPANLRDALAVVFAELSHQREISVPGGAPSRALLAAEDLVLPYRVHGYR